MCTPSPRLGNRGSPSIPHGKALRRKASCSFVALRGKAYDPHGFAALRGPLRKNKHAARLRVHSWHLVVKTSSARLRVNSWHFVVKPIIRMASRPLAEKTSMPQGFVFIRGTSW